MIQAVEEVNKTQELGNLTLGYRILDTCADPTTALRNSLSFLKLNNSWMNGAEQASPPVLAVIGSHYSEISMVSTRLLNLENIPLISYGSTAGQLGDKTRFPSFMRTVPEDDHQAHVIIKILKRHNWTWVGLVATDSVAGRYAVERLQKHAGDTICFAFISILPEVLIDKSLEDAINDTVERIVENQKVTVMVSFAKVDHMMYLFGSLLKDPRGRDKVWVAGDNWSESTKVLGNLTLKDVGTVIGIVLKSGNITKYEQNLKNLDVNPDNHKNNTFLYEYLKTKKPNSKVNEELIKGLFPSVTNVELAVRAIAKAVSDLCINRDCKKTQKLQALELREALRKATFHMDGVDYKFDKKGDLNTGYDVILWKQTPTSLEPYSIVAVYCVQNQSLTFFQETLQDYKSVTTGVISRCSDSCPPGKKKHLAKGLPVCCYECKKCPLDQFSNISDAAVCLKCNTDTHYSEEGSTRCLPRKDVFLDWNDFYHQILLSLSSIGVLLTIIVGIIFLARWNTPVVRASVGPICVLLLLSLLSTFLSVAFFGGKPKLWMCKARQVMFGLSFTLCVSCIMVKSFKIILAFEFNPGTKRVLKKLYQPYIIIAVSFLGQVLICALWLALQSPTAIQNTVFNRKEILHRCEEKSYAAFGAMLSYIGVLALICFALAFKGRKLPQSYNDAKFITFSMLIYFIGWIIFGPVYVSVTNQYRPAVEMVVILISAYGILFCQFMTKCYVILFKQKVNRRSMFLTDVRNFAMGDLTDERNGDFAPRSMSVNGIQNPASNSEVPASDLPSEQSRSISSDEPSCSFCQQQNNPYVNKKQLKRYLSSPASLCDLMDGRDFESIK
ncbi:G-protein coupled receptor family C group 6 member A-like [Halichoeres trimaculatus]|uniref:G-protein coupled receptor family C group 6 member A-like n=1 Tax=Halichoeres trimaculatus TaxID=147232 RepID=UPI003D9F5F1F